MSLWALSHFVNCREARQNQGFITVPKFDFEFWHGFLEQWQNFAQN